MGLNSGLQYRLESRTHKVDIKAHKDIHLESKGGDILVQSFENNVLEADRDIVFDSQRVDFKQLPRYQRPVDESSARASYQVSRQTE